MNKRIWRTHTGSAPECQYTPRAIISDWFYGENPRIKDARDCLMNLIEGQRAQDEEYDQEHRCFNRRDYELDLDDIKDIIRELKKV